MFFTTGTFLLCGSTLSKKINEDYWLVWAFQLLIFLLLTVAYVIVLIVLIAILFLAEDSGFDVEFPDITNYVTPSSKKVKAHEKMKDFAKKKTKKYAKKKLKERYSRSKPKFPKKNKRLKHNPKIQFTDEFEFEDLVDKYAELWYQFDLYKESL